MPASFLPLGSRVPVQVHCPVSYPILKSHMWDGGGAVQSEHPRALPVHPLRPEPGQPQLREPRVHTGQMVHILRHVCCLLLWRCSVCPISSLSITAFILSFIHLFSLHSWVMINFCFSWLSLLFISLCHSVRTVDWCFNPHCCPILGLFLDSLGVWSAACLSVPMLWGCLPSQ